jgi:hypothetical protein
MLVPLSTVLAVLLAIPTLWTFTPGANISTAVPKLENEARVSVALSIAPTVMADGAEAGESFNASCYFMSASSFDMNRRYTFSFPAATTQTTPALVAAAIAEFKAVDLEPPIDMLTTAFPASPLEVAFVVAFQRQLSSFPGK